MANSFFGKFQQKSRNLKPFVSNQSQLEPHSKINSIFCINDNLCQLEIERDLKCSVPNRQ
jgi:hypothetical protein